MLKKIWKFWESRKKITCDYTIWIDGSIQVKSPLFIEELISNISKYGIAMFVHPDRDCIYEELLASLPMKKYKNRPLQEQIDSYKKQEYPIKNGLMAAGVIVRKTDTKRLKKIDEDWWQENIIWTYQDQLSLPYVLWKNKYWYDEIKLNLWNNHLFDWINHHSDL